MESNHIVYVMAMQDSLRKKYMTLKKILDVTRQQEEIVSQKEMEIEEFESLLDTKNGLIQNMQTLDDGFERLYEGMREELQGNQQAYRSQIQEIQKLLHQITDIGVKIQALERRNKEKFEKLVMRKKQEIQEYHVNSRTANLYSRNMTGQHQEWQTYFFDKKN